MDYLYLSCVVVGTTARGADIPRSSPGRLFTRYVLNSAASWRSRLANSTVDHRPDLHAAPPRPYRLNLHMTCRTSPTGFLGPVQERLISWSELLRVADRDLMIGLVGRAAWSR